MGFTGLSPLFSQPCFHLLHHLCSMARMLQMGGGHRRKDIPAQTADPPLQAFFSPPNAKQGSQQHYPPMPAPPSATSQGRQVGSETLSMAWPALHHRASPGGCKGVSAPPHLGQVPAPGVPAARTPSPLIPGWEGAVRNLWRKHNQVAI